MSIDVIRVYYPQPVEVINLTAPVTPDVIRIGLPGPQGPSGGADVSRTAAATINGHRAIMVTTGGQVEHLDCTAVNNADQALGISTGAATIGNAASVRITGALDEGSWSWTPLLPVYATGAGLLTQSIPSSPDTFILRVGFAETATRLFIDLGEPLYLS